MKRFHTLLCLAAAVVLMDRLSKLWVLRHFTLGESRPVTAFFHLTFVQNTGTAFGLFQQHNQLLLVISWIILAVLLFASRGLCERGGCWACTGVGLVLGGAIGNMIDRSLYGQVVDFLDFRVWPVFNLADSAITVGIVALMLGLRKR